MALTGLHVRSRVLAVDDLAPSGGQTFSWDIEAEEFNAVTSWTSVGGAWSASQVVSAANLASIMLQYPNYLNAPGNPVVLDLSVTPNGTGSITVEFEVTDDASGVMYDFSDTLGHAYFSGNLAFSGLGWVIFLNGLGQQAAANLIDYVRDNLLVPVSNASLPAAARPSRFLIMDRFVVGGDSLKYIADTASYGLSWGDTVLEIPASAAYRAQAISKGMTGARPTGFTIGSDYEQELSADKLGALDVIYATEQHLPPEGRAALLTWSQLPGKVLALSPNALSRDWYDEDDVAAATLTGIAATRRDAAYTHDGSDTSLGTVTGPSGTITAYGPWATLTASGGAGATVYASRSDAAAGIIVKSVGQGTVVYYSFFAGLSYWRSQTGTVDGLPAGFSSVLEDWIRKPCDLAAVALPASHNHRGVELQTWESDLGHCVYCGNWTGADIPNFTLTVPLVTGPKSAAVASGNPLTESYAGGVATASWTLPAGGDFLILADEIATMSITLQTLVGRAKRRYGMLTIGEDQLLTDQHFIDGVNEVISDLHMLAGGLRESFTVNLPTTAQVPLDDRIVRLEENTLRLDYDGSGQYSSVVEYADERMLRSLMGPLERLDAGVPLYWYGQRGSGSALLNLTLVPASDKAVTNGIKFDARTVPADLANPTDLVPIRAVDESQLIPGVCMVIAQSEASRGRRDAPVAMWSAAYQQAGRDFVSSVEQSLRASHPSVHYDMDPGF